jgi:hypothetical protein
MIEEHSQLLRWLDDHADEANADRSVTATFVVDDSGKLRLSSRRSEHIACASGRPVLSAGEMSFDPNGEVVDVNNHSTGFCPEPASWPTCAVALDRLGITHPNTFTREVTFRRCPQCGERNVVKDDWYVCDLCGGDLPREWNFQ